MKQSNQPTLAGRGLVLGRYVADSTSRQKAPITCEDRRLLPHLHRPWFRAYLRQRLGEPVGATSQRQVPTGEAVIPLETLRRHGFACGSSGGGKSRSLIHLLMSQIEAGTSVAIIDGKGETIDRMLTHLVAARIPPEQVLLIDPSYSEGGPPAANPLTVADLPLLQMVGDLVSVVESSSLTWGNRLGDLLTNALIVAGSFRLSLYEAVQCIVREDFRTALLSLPIQPSEPLAYGEAVSYFEAEYGTWSRSERSNAAAAVTNKIREWLRSPFLWALLCARQKRSRLDFASLWRRPQVILVRIDRPALGDAGARLVVSLLCNMLLRTALRQKAGEGTVLLALDELGMLARYIGPVVADTLAVARSQGLCLLCCFQHFDQFSDNLRAALLSNCAYQLLFRSGPQDARPAALSLAAGGDSGITSFNLAIDKEDADGDPEFAEWRHVIYDAAGRPIHLSPFTWARFKQERTWGAKGLQRFKQLALASGARRIYVKAPDIKAPVEIGAYLRDAPETAYHIDGPQAALILRFPRPKISGVSRNSEADAVRTYVRCLQDMPVQHCLLRLAGHAPGIVKVADIPTPAVADAKRDRYIAAVVAATGQSLPEVDADIRYRQALVEHVAKGRLRPRKEEEDDSLY